MSAVVALMRSFCSGAVDDAGEYALILASVLVMRSGIFAWPWTTKCSSLFRSFNCCSVKHCGDCPLHPLLFSTYFYCYNNLLSGHCVELVVEKSDVNVRSDFYRICVSQILDRGPYYLTTSNILSKHGKLMIWRSKFWLIFNEFSHSFDGIFRSNKFRLAHVLIIIYVFRPPLRHCFNLWIYL